MEAVNVPLEPSECMMGRVDHALMELPTIHKENCVLQFVQVELSGPHRTKNVFAHLIHLTSKEFALNVKDMNFSTLQFKDASKSVTLVTFTT